MIKKVKRRFISIAMLAFLAVLLVTLVAVNWVNGYNVYNSIDQQLVFLADSDFGPPRGMLAAMPETIQEWVDMEAGDITSEDSYFIFSGGMMANVLDDELQTLSEATGMDAAAKLDELLAEGKDYGNFGSYRYYVASREVPYKVVFLRCTQEFSAMRSLLKTSILVGFVCLVAVFSLVTLLAGLVVRPFAQNIQRQKRFISDVTHELKTPLGVIMADLDMQVMDHGTSEWLENARSQTDHMTRLIDRLVTRSLLDESMHRAEAVRINLSLLAGDMLAEFEPTAKSKKLLLRAELAPGAEVYGSEESLREVITILLDNAVKYTPEGGNVFLQIRRGRHVALELSNTCPELEETDPERFFDRFYRDAAARGSQPGHGLGLSIARDLVEQSGGHIRVRLEGENIVFAVEF